MAHRVHLDYASSAPLRPQVRSAMANALEKDPFDPRRLYDDAITARYEIETSREQVANFFGCDPFEVIFTSSHSESLATFAFGSVESTDGCSVVTTSYDSEIIAKTWERENVDTRILGGNSSATLDLDLLENLVDETTVAMTIPFAHPDTGTLQDIEKIVSIVRSKNSKCLIHVDARLAAGNVSLNFSETGIDAISVDPSTFGGPTGVAGLILSRSIHISPLLTGSTQERARRAGLENQVGIAGFGALCESTKLSLVEEIQQFRILKTKIVDALKSAGALSLDFDPDSIRTLPNVTCAYFPGIAASAVVAEFNRMGINIHAGSSCGSEEFEPSTQLAPVTRDDSISESVFRISTGYATTDDDIESFVAALKSLPFSV